MSTLGVVAKILREVAPRALKVRQIATLAGLRLPTTSKTPETVAEKAEDLGNAVACHEVPAVVARAEVLIAATQEASLA